MSRVTPLHVLTRVVRGRFEAKEYPSSMRRLFNWTPDECIPAFFTDPRIFRSRHRPPQQAVLPDIELPAWTDDADEFVQYHMQMLESRHVSAHLHHWIDLNFGWLLSAATPSKAPSAAAVAAMNVTLPPATQQTPPGLGGGTLLRVGPGFVKLFDAPHPPRAAAALPPPFSPVEVLAHAQAEKNLQRALNEAQLEARATCRSSCRCSCSRCNNMCAECGGNGRSCCCYRKRQILLQPCLWRAIHHWSEYRNGHRKGFW